MSGPLSPTGRLVALVLSATFVLGACGGGDGESGDGGPDAIRRAEGIEAGDCYQQPEDERTTVEPIACDRPHDNEAYAAFQLRGGDYPGDAQVRRAATERCLERFAGFVGVVYAESALDIDALTPTRLTWEEGDRKTVCVLFRTDGEPLRGSAEGTNA